MSADQDDYPVMPKQWGLRYLFFIVCRWIYYNPLTILLAFEDIAVQLVADHPTWRWLGTVAGVLGIIIAQVRNSGKDYRVPIAQQPGPTPPVKPAPTEISK